MADAWDSLLGAGTVDPSQLRAYRPPDPVTSAYGAFIGGALRQTIPTTGGVAAFPIGAEAGGAFGAAVTGGNPVAGLIGAGAGGLATSFGAGVGLEKLQRWSLDKLTDGAYTRWEQQDAEQHPTATFLGGLAPQLAFMRPGAFTWKGAVAGAAIGGGTEAGQEYAQTGTIDPLKVGAQAAFGGLLQHNSQLGDFVQQPAVTLAAGVRRGIGATIARAAADRAINDTLASAPDADQAIAQAAARLTDPNLNDATRQALARSQALDSLFGDRRTPQEIAAGHVIDGDALTEASRPADMTDESHGAAVTAALTHAAAGLPIPEPPRPVFSGDAQVAQRIIQIESGGNPTAHARGTSASGPGQFTDSTWLGLFRRAYAVHTGDWSARNLTDDQVLDLKSDPETARTMTQLLVAENRRMLDREHLPVTDTNLYLLHFLGPHGMALMRADPATPVSELLPESFLHANRSVLEGKTAGDVIAWAAHKMGEPIAPAQPTALHQAMADAGLGDLVPGFDDESLFDRSEDFGDPFGAPAEPVRTIARDDILSAVNHPDGIDMGEAGDWLRDQSDTALAEGRSVTLVLGDRRIPIVYTGLRDNRGQTWGAMPLLAPRPGEAAHLEIADSPTAEQTAPATEPETTRTEPALPEPIRPRRKPVRKGPTDAITFLAEKGGIRDDEGHALGKYGRRVVGTGGYRAGRDLNRFIPGVGPLIRKSGMSIDRAGELLHEAGYFGPTDQRPDVNAVLDMLERSRWGKIYTPEDQAALDATSGNGAQRPLEHYGEPNGIGEQAETDSLDHDIQMAVEADPALSVQLGADGKEVRVADLLEQLDEDENAIGALKACATPGGDA